MTSEHTTTEPRRLGVLRRLVAGRRWVRETDPFDNLRAATVTLLQRNDIDFDPEELSDALRAHPRFPSLTSAVETAAELGVRLAAARCEESSLDELPLPALAQVESTPEERLVLIEAVEEAVVRVLDPRAGRTLMGRSVFVERWTGLTILVAGAVPAAEGAAEERPKPVARAPKWLVAALAILSGGLGVAVLWMALAEPTELRLMAGLEIIGMILAAPLVAYRFPKDGWLQRVCAPGAAVDCSAVLASPKARLFGWLPLADLGLVIFAGGLVGLVVAAALEVAALAAVVLAGLAALALPATLYLVIYQVVRVRRLCWLCLGALSVLWAQAFLYGDLLSDLVRGNGAGSQLATSGGEVVSALGLGFGGIAFAWWLISAGIVHRRDLRETRTAYRRVKRTPEVVTALLERAPRRVLPDVSLALGRGRRGAPVTLTLLTDPRCPHCAEVFRQAESLHSRFGNRLALEVRFICDPWRDGEVAARHVLALEAAGRAGEAMDLLTKIFRDRLPGEELRRHGPVRRSHLEDPRITRHLERMRDWADSNRVALLPITLANGRELPADLEPQDLRAWIGAGGRLSQRAPGL